MRRTARIFLAFGDWVDIIVGFVRRQRSMDTVHVSKRGDA
tara:strand:- start:221 stop:340 length:120 start_codon:yes stop_codon:yes gene_type:complete